MRNLFRHFLPALFLGIWSLTSFAQTTPDYTISLQGGSFVPVQNIKAFCEQPDILEQSKFGNKYYVAIQFWELPGLQEKQNLRNAGIQLLDYLPYNAYLAAVSIHFNRGTLSNSKARAIFQLKGTQKTAPALMNMQFPGHAIKTTGTVDVQLTTYEQFSLDYLNSSFKNTGAEVLEESPLFKNITVRIPQQNYLALLNLPFVSWIEAIDAPNKTEDLPGRTLHRVNILNDGVRNLKGNGVNIGIWDEGEVYKHVDFSQLSQRLIIQESGTVSTHSSHCGGILAGGGFINPKARGMAPKAKLYSWDFDGNIQNEMAAAIPALGLSVSSHSYGSTQTCGLTGSGVAYSTTSRNTDLNLNNFPYHLQIHSAGNSQTACTGGWSTITSSGKSAKNNILVANISTIEGISGSSSFGPVADGRVKPEISSFGTNVLSTYPDNQYATISGTSMATPGVAGTVALLVERYRQLNANAEPPSALIKNTILNTAFDLGNTGPDYKFGYGRLNALDAVRILEQNRYAIGSISTGEVNDITLNVPANASKLRVMITWNDPAALANANPALVNNLDLSVTNGSNTALPWVLDPNNPNSPATTGIDNVSNIEQVVIENPAAGTYTLKVAGTAIPVSPQQYSITWTVEQPSIEVIYPNGNESFAPGTTETITWNNSGISAAQTVEYSLNNGTTWNIISTTVPPKTTRLNWAPPAGTNTSAALIRVSSGSISDVSDANFHILSIPTGLSTIAGCTTGEITFTWNASATATHYDLIKIDTTTGSLVTMGANLTTTSYTVSGLAPGSTHWFCIVAKNNSTGAVSDRSIAVNVIANPINATSVTASGPTSFCEGGMVQLTASDAANYIWSNGATSQSIIVNSSGNYGVTTTNANGCVSSSAPVAVNVLPTIQVSLTASPYTALYPGINTTLTASPANATNYTWYKNGELLPSVTGNTLPVSINELGAYSVTVIAASGCSNSSNIITIKDSAINRLFIYPNPNDGRFAVAYHNRPGSKQAITIYDSKGAKVYSKSFSLNAVYEHMPVDIHRNSKGIYYVVLTDDKGVRIASKPILIH